MNLLCDLRPKIGVLVLQAYRILLIVRSGILLVLTIFSLSAGAAEIKVTALFRPDSANPQNNKFTITSVSTFNCTSELCKYAAKLPIKFFSSGPIQPFHSDYRQGVTFKIPVKERLVKVINTSTGQESDVFFKVTGFGSTYITSNVFQLAGTSGHSGLWEGGTFLYSVGVCKYTGDGLTGHINYTWFWRLSGEGYCSKKAQVLIPNLYYDYLAISYDVLTPKPLEMDDGLYVGSVHYSVGPFKDFDMGDIMLPSDDSVVVNFELRVQHTLKVEVPPGGNRVELVPEGGWQKWLNTGSKPQRLFRDQTFNISSSTKFKMQLECPAGQVGDTCALRNNAGDQVPLDVFVSMPVGFTSSNGGVANRVRLGVGAGEVFENSYYVHRNPGKLHFEVQKQGVQDMLKSNAPIWNGTVSVVWDSVI